jgi:hypothetical protein
MSGKKYSVILMRDDDHVRRYRMSSLWFKFGIFAFIFLFLLSAGGIYFTVDYWNKYRDLSKANTVLQGEIQSKEVELERLRNMERMVLAHQEDPVPGDTNATTANATREEANATVEEDSATEQANATKAEAAPDFEYITPPELTTVLDKGETAISELSLQHTDAGYSIHFMVSNEKSQGSLTGLVSLLLIAKNGSLHKIDAPKEALDFTIQRFKTINLDFDVPDAIEKDDVFGLLVKVTNKAGDLIYSKSYPIQDLVSS